jgi:hypothetical protein
MSKKSFDVPRRASDISFVQVICNVASFSITNHSHMWMDTSISLPSYNSCERHPLEDRSSEPRRARSTKTNTGFMEKDTVRFDNVLYQLLYGKLLLALLGSDPAMPTHINKSVK